MRLGVDIGSKTIKLALVDESGSLAYSYYAHHRAQVKDALLRALDDCLWHHGDQPITITVTGSSGLRLAELFGYPFVQEVVALKRAIDLFESGTDVILEMGGEDTKLIYLSGTPEQRMNTICAGGTGGFIESMAGLMGKSVEAMEELASGGQAIFSIASRCAVFAKSDIRPLLNSGAHRSDIAASVLEAVCIQAVAGLSCGRPIEGKVALLGGPFQHIPALRRAFCSVTGLPESDVTVPDNAHLLVAIGATAGRSDERSEPTTIEELRALVQRTSFASDNDIATLPPLFTCDEELEAFRERHAATKIPQRPIGYASKNLFVGVDAGSTTMKTVLIDETGAVCDYHYTWNKGDVTSSLPELLIDMHRAIRGSGPDEKVIRNSCIVGYGEDFCKAAYGIDFGEVETVAHLRAATALKPEVDLLIDIGGQDIKCFHTADGHIEDVVLNEACSSGCGSLFDSVARSVHKTKEAFAKEALLAEKPVDMGTRCSVFMDSRVKHAQKAGSTHGDIAAGIAYSTARNALFKVLREPSLDASRLTIMVQGGAFANDALLRAFELETGAKVYRPDHSEIMGAWGAALLARDRWLAAKQADEAAALAQVSTIASLDQLKSMKIKQSSARCQLCGNACKLRITTFTSLDGYEGTYVLGNKCNRGAAAFGCGTDSAKRRPPNLIQLKHDLIAKALKNVPERATRTVAIPAILNLYEALPFWTALFSSVGLNVITNEIGSETAYAKGMGRIPAEGACQPFKLAYGYIAELLEQGPDFLFVPRMGLHASREGLLGMPAVESLRECPLVDQFSDLAADAFQDAGTQLLTPTVAQCSSPETLQNTICALFDSMGLSLSDEDVAAAIEAAQTAYGKFFATLDKACQRTLAEIDAGTYPGVMLAAHPYHGDPSLSHHIDKLMVDLGYAVLEHPDCDFATRQQLSIWPSINEALHNAHVCLEHPNLQLVTLRSFGCGVDAMAADQLRDLMKEHSRIYTELKLDQIVDLAAVRIRLRSLAYATSDAATTFPLDTDAFQDNAAGGTSFVYTDPAAIARNRHKVDRGPEQLIKMMSKLGFTRSDANESVDTTRIVFNRIPARSLDDNTRYFDSWDEVADFVETQQLCSPIPMDIVPPGQNASVHAMSPEERMKAGTEDHTELLAKMEEHGYVFIIDNTMARGLAVLFFPEIIFDHNGDSKKFKSWQAVQDFADAL